MKRFLCSLCFFITCLIIGYAQQKTYYVSSTLGNINNDGLSKESPVARISDIKEHEGIKILLKKGDIFYENLSGYNSCMIASYGKGRKPMLCGFKILKNTNAWSFDYTNACWKLDMEDQENFAGFVASGFENNVGCIYDSYLDKLFGRLVYSIGDMQENGDFFTTSKCNKSEVSDSDFKYLYFKSTSSPTELGNLCFSVFKSGVSNMNNCIIRDISIVGFGIHGMCSIDKCTIDNCDLDIIGGSIQIGKSPWVRYGNGIEFYINSEPVGDILVKECLVSRTYDCGASIQGTGDNMGSPHNIRFFNNRFIWCRQAYEHFLQSYINPVSYENCSFDHNISLFAGENQFGCPEIRDAAVLSYELQPKDCIITNNIFYGNNYYFGNMMPDGMTDNVVYLYLDQYLHHSHFKAPYIPVLYADKEGIDAYVERTGDRSKIVVLKKGSIRDKWMIFWIKNKIGWVRPELHLERVL